MTCLFSAIGYAETLDGLQAAARALAAHLAPDGVLLVEPWVAPSDGIRFAEAIDSVARVGVGAPRDGVFVSETHYLVARADGVEHFSESHVLGLFQRADYTQALSSAGLEQEFLPDDRGLFVCVQPGSPSAASAPPV